MNILLFEDLAVGQLNPVTTGRPAYTIFCGGYRLVDLIAELGHPVRGAVRHHLEAIQRADFPALANELVPKQPLLLVNARLVPSASAIIQLGRWAREAEPSVVKNGEHVLAALLPANEPPPPSDLQTDQLEDYFHYAGVLNLQQAELDLYAFEYPHDIVRQHVQCLSSNLEHRLQVQDYREIADGVFAAEGAELGQYVVSDTRRGPILLDAHAQIGPYCYLSGPAYIGPGARVLEHAAIKDAVALGHTTKMGGEVEASIIEPYTNKQHHGFLGHSYVGSWVNLGAGTCNSDLKNTYGEVKMEYRGRKVTTEMQFVGCFIGDYAKTAINTSIFTGKTIGVCSMLYGFVTTNVPSFVNYARSFGQVTEMPADVMVATQARMFQRRNVQQRPCDIQLLHDMYRITQDERQLAGEPLSL